MQLENHPLDRKTFIVKQDSCYVINRVITQGDDVQRSAQTYLTKDMEGFISEGWPVYILVVVAVVLFIFTCLIQFMLTMRQSS